MRDARAWLILLGVSDEVLRIAVEVDCAAEEIHGQACRGVWAPAFSGWLALIGALDSKVGSPDRLGRRERSQRRQP